MILDQRIIYYGCMSTIRVMCSSKIILLQRGFVWDPSQVSFVSSPSGVRQQDKQHVELVDFGVLWVVDISMSSGDHRLVLAARTQHPDGRHLAHVADHDSH